MPKVAIIGLGYWGPNLVRNFQAVIGRDLRLACDVDERRRSLIAERYPSVRCVADTQAVFDDPEIDAVAIATPVHSHAALIRQALEAGKSVLVEKPFTADLEKARELVNLARERDLVLMVDHVFVYSEAVKKIKAIVDQGELGEILFIDSVRINLGLIQEDVNVVWDLAPHDLSIIDYLLDRLPRSVATFGSAHSGRSREDVAYLSLDFGSGLIASVHVNWLSPVKVRYTMIGGSKKSLIYNDLEPHEKIKVYDSGVIVRRSDVEGLRRQMFDYRIADVWSPHVPQKETLINVVEHFVECVGSHLSPITSGERALQVLQVLSAAEKSIHAQGGRITLWDSAPPAGAP